LGHLHADPQPVHLVHPERRYTALVSVPLINVDDLGDGRAALNMLGIFALLLAVGWVYLVIDRRLPTAPTR